MDNINSKQIVLNGLLINYYLNNIEDSKKTIIFIHGWLSESRVWFHLMHALTKASYECFAIDLPGFGQSQVPESSVDNTFYADIIDQFVKKLNLSNVVLVGHSNGGAVCVKYLNKDSANVVQLILIDSAGIREQTTTKRIKRFIAEIVRPIFKFSLLKPLRNKIYRVMGSEDYINSEYLHDTYKNVVNEDISDLFINVKVPTLIIWGENDGATPLRYADFIHSSIEGSQLVVLDTGHFPFQEKPSEVINEIITFIK